MRQVSLSRLNKKDQKVNEVLKSKVESEADEFDYQDRTMGSR